MLRRSLALAFTLFMLPATALAQTWTPGPNAVGDSTLIGFVDTPKTDESFKPGDKINMVGWVVDNTATGWTGIDEVHVYRGTSADEFVGRAAYGVERQDVANHFSNQGWMNSGFSLMIDTSKFSGGSNTLTIYAHTPLKGWWSKTVIVTVAKDLTASDPSERVNWKTPHNHTVTTVPSLVPALTLLSETGWGNWALDIPADKGLQVLWSSDLGDRFSLYQYGTRLILVNDKYKNAQPRALAAAIAHELQHSLDDVYGWSGWRAVSCLDLASRSFLAQAAAWQAFYGPFGKVQPIDQLEQAHNAVLTAVTARPATWLEDAVSRYRSPCN